MKWFDGVFRRQATNFNWASSSEEKSPKKINFHLFLARCRGVEVFFCVTRRKKKKRRTKANSRKKKHTIVLNTLHFAHVVVVVVCRLSFVIVVVDPQPQPPPPPPPKKQHPLPARRLPAGVLPAEEAVRPLAHRHVGRQDRVVPRDRARAPRAVAGGGRAEEARARHRGQPRGGRAGEVDVRGADGRQGRGRGRVRGFCFLFFDSKGGEEEGREREREFKKKKKKNKTHFLSFFLLSLSINKKKNSLSFIHSLHPARHRTRTKRRSSQRSRPSCDKSPRAFLSYLYSRGPSRSTCSSTPTPAPPCRSSGRTRTRG